MSSIISKFAKRLKSLREERNLTHEELAFRCSMERAHYSKIEGAKKDVQLSTIEKLANGLDVQAYELLKFE